MAASRREITRENEKRVKKGLLADKTVCFITYNRRLYRIRAAVYDSSPGMACVQSNALPVGTATTGILAPLMT